jgi:hypothetical protein
MQLIQISSSLASERTYIGDMGTCCDWESYQLIQSNILNAAVLAPKLSSLSKMNVKATVKKSNPLKFFNRRFIKVKT